MADTRITKTSIDREQLALIATLADAKGISITKMLEQIIVHYLATNSNQ